MGMLGDGLDRRRDLGYLIENAAERTQPALDASDGANQVADRPERGGRGCP